MGSKAAIITTREELKQNNMEVFFVNKEVVKVIKLQIEAGKATPAPPVGTVLGPAGINLGEFCTKYNEATREQDRKSTRLNSSHAR